MSVVLIFSPFFTNLRAERNVFEYVSRFLAIVPDFKTERNELSAQFLTIFRNFRRERSDTRVRFLAIFALFDTRKE